MILLSILRMPLQYLNIQGRALRLPAPLASFPSTGWQMPVYSLSDDPFFPPPHLARRDGLLAVGGDLHMDRLLAAYYQGIFPWYSEGEPILWWSPDPRLVLYPKEFRMPKRLARTIRTGGFQVTADRAFGRIIEGCAHVRSANRLGTWLCSEMIDAYKRLHAEGYAHSVEVWRGDQLAGGLYGVSLGRAFFGESMFTLVRDASKVGLAILVEGLRQRSFDFIDCQVRTQHLISLGAREIPRFQFLAELENALRHSTIRGRWDFLQELSAEHFSSEEFS